MQQGLDFHQVLGLQTE